MTCRASGRARGRARPPGDRHGVRLRAALPGAAVPRPGGGARPGRARRRADRGARPAGRRASSTPAPLAAVLADPAVEVVVHAGRQDVGLLRRTWRTEVTNIFDTQVAAGFLGFGNQEGYESLVRKVMNVRLGGAEGFTTLGQAAALRRSRSPTRATTPAACSRSATRSSERLARQRPARVGARGVAPARGRQRRARRRARLRAPAAPRRASTTRAGRSPASSSSGASALAESMDRPPPFVLPDQALVELARRRPRDKAGLEHIRGPAAADAPPPRRPAARGDRSRAAGASRRPRPRKPPSRDSRDAPVVSLAQALVRHRSMESGVAVELIATQAELAAAGGRAAAGRARRPTARG